MWINYTLSQKERRMPGINFDEAGFAYVEKGIPIGIDTFKRALTKK